MCDSVCVWGGAQECGLVVLTPLLIIKSTLFSGLWHFLLSICSPFSQPPQKQREFAHTHTHTWGHTLILMIYNNLKACQIFLIGHFFQRRGPTVWHPFIFLYSVLCHLSVLLSSSIYSYSAGARFKCWVAECKLSLNHSSPLVTDLSV